MSELSTDPYKGVRDFYPREHAVRDAVFGKIRETLQSWGYEEYNASPLERSELYESKGSEEIVNEQTYTFEDRGGRRVTLRTEMTPTLARMVAGKRRELPFPLRWYSIGNRFRYERPQKGRLREFYQTDVDLIGLPEGEADREAVVLASAILRAFGASEKDFVIRINSRALLSAACKAAGLTEENAAREYWRLVDRKAKMTPEEFAAARSGFSADPLKVIEEESDEAVAAEKRKLEALVADLKARGVTNARYDMEVVRGFDYYTGMVFEVFDTNQANPRSLMGGGRYDGLVALFGGDPIPAVGFAFGDVTLMDFLETHNLLPEVKTAPQVYIGTPSPADIPDAQAFAATLRLSGLRVFVNLTEKALGDQVKDADKRGIRYFIAYGSEERQKEMVEVKDLPAHEARTVPLEDVARTIG